MASVRTEALIEVSADKAWAKLRDVGSPQHLFAGVLTDATLESDIRTVTFANGLVARERIVDIDEDDHRVAYSVLNDIFEHHSASMQIFPAGEQCCRFVWISDFLPNERAPLVRPLVEQGCAAMKRTLEAPG